MAELNADDLAKLHAAIANLQRAMEDVQSLYHLQKRADHDIYEVRAELSTLQERVKRQDRLLADLLDDKKSIFRWVLAVIGTFVVTASLVALNLKV